VARLAAALRPADRDREDVELVPLLEACVHGALERGPALNVRLDGLGVLPPVRGSRQTLAGCFVQLVRNAAQASPGGALHVTGDVEDGMVVLRFTDDGPGIPRELRHRIFEPFFTTRRVGEGYGLGLTEVHFVARDHGGTVLLEPSEPGTCVAVRLPVARPVAPGAQPQEWPMPAAVVAAAAVSLVLVVLPSAAARVALSVCLQVGAAAVAAAAMAWTAARHQGRARRFWAALAAGPAIWALTRALRVVEGGWLGAERGGVWHIGFFALAELAWVVALLVRPDRPRERMRSAPWVLGVAAAFCLCTYIYSYLVMLPAPYGAWDMALRQQTALWRGVLRVALAGCALALALRAATPYWRSLFGRLGLLIALWGLGQTLAGVFRSRPLYSGGAITDLGWIVPLLLLAGFAITEGLRAPRRESMPAPTAAQRPLWTAAELASLAALPAFDALMGPSAHPDLDLARRGMTWSAVVVVGALLAAREYFTHREPTARRRPRLSSATSGMEPERLLKVVSTAVYEMAGHLSGITALARLVLTQSDASGRVRGDSERIQTRADMAARIARNLIALLQGGTATPELASVNRLVDEVLQLRGADLEHEGIRLARSLDPQLPAVWWVHAPAVRQALLCCLDGAAVALRADGRRGTLEVTTGQEGDELVVRLHADGQGLPRSVLAPLSSGRFDSRQDPDLGLSLAREILLQYCGTLSGRHRAQGGAELVIRLPMIAMPAAPETRWLGLGAGAPRSN
jgi:signal transduction histidine kinase